MCGALNNARVDVDVCVILKRKYFVAAEPRVFVIGWCFHCFETANVLQHLDWAYTFCRLDDH